MDGTGSLFEPLRAALPAGLRTRVFSYAPSIGSYDELLTSLPAPARPVVVLAESFGGPLALRLAMRGGISHVVLVASFVRPPRRLLHVAAPWVARLPAPPAPAVRLAMVGLDADAVLVEQVQRAIASTPASSLARRVHALADLDLVDAVRSLDVPITAVVASRDRLVPRHRAEEPARLARRGAVLHVDGPHLLAQARPRDVARVVVSLLGGAVDVG